MNRCVVCSGCFFYACACSKIYHRRWRVDVSIRRTQLFAFNRTNISTVAREPGPANRNLSVDVLFPFLVSQAATERVECVFQFRTGILIINGDVIGHTAFFGRSSPVRCADRTQTTTWCIEFDDGWAKLAENTRCSTQVLHEHVSSSIARY